MRGRRTLTVIPSFASFTAIGQSTLILYFVYTIRGGEKVFIDYAGLTIPYRDAKTGDQHQAQVFVATLGASSYTYAEAQSSQDLTCWIGGHVRAFEYFNGVSRAVVIDNLKTGVTSACFYEPELNATYQELAVHYGTAVLPTRVRRPRDKDQASYYTPFVMLDID